MFAFNRRLDPPTILGVPKKSAAGILAVSVVCFLAVGLKTPLIALLLSPAVLAGIFFIVTGFRQLGSEHLLMCIADARKDMHYNDLGIKDD